MKSLFMIVAGVLLMAIVLTISPPVKYEQQGGHAYQIYVTDTDSVKVYDGTRFIGTAKLGQDSVGLIGLINKDKQ